MIHTCIHTYIHIHTHTHIHTHNEMKGENMERAVDVNIEEKPHAIYSVETKRCWNFQYKWASIWRVMWYKDSLKTFRLGKLLICFAICNDVITSSYVFSSHSNMITLLVVKDTFWRGVVVSSAALRRSVSNCLYPDKRASPLICMYVCLFVYFSVYTWICTYECVYSFAACQRVLMCIALDLDIHVCVRGLHMYLTCTCFPQQLLQRSIRNMEICKQPEDL